ncbi:DNA gyrase subunit B [Vigna unguiculata]|uniref:DNA gyrase subunit B n=1 Tax=Vigna unguiculata TaxID=3917 RepID=A0A4D6M890_VIGUN|nr:DNA gyrase subunit B [Vigna unguiculata]QCD97044.1 DNA gyrase subunit B [Vigna unguiculata]
MAQVLLYRPPLLRFMASRFFIHSSFHTRFSSLPPSTLTKTRTSFHLRKFLVPCSVSIAATPRAFMSSVPTTEAFQKSESSTAYGSDQIQVLTGAGRLGPCAEKARDVHWKHRPSRAAPFGIFL